MPNYFAIDDILATQERTPCKFVVNVPALGNDRYIHLYELYFQQTAF